MGAFVIFGAHMLARCRNLFRISCRRNILLARNCLGENTINMINNMTKNSLWELLLYSCIYVIQWPVNLSSKHALSMC